MAKGPGFSCADCGGPKWSDGPRPCRTCKKVGNRKPRDCEVCGAAFKPTHSLQRTCGRQCGSLINAKTASAKPKFCRIVFHPCDICGRVLTRPRLLRCSRECQMEAARRHSRINFESQARPSSLPCADCGDTYTTKTAANGGVCKKCRRRRLKRDRGTSDRRRARDAGVLYEPISRAKVYERDGDHVYANVQCAHFICNTLKGNREGGRGCDIAPTSAA